MNQAVASATHAAAYREALGEALTLGMERDPAIFLMGEDIGVYGGVYQVTQGLLNRFGPDRVRETPISEAAFVGLGIGAAMMGKHPVVELMFMDFALVAADQLFNQAAKMRYLSGGQFRVPLTVRTQQGVGVGTGAQHSQNFEALFAHIPGFAIATPATPADAKGLLTTALRAQDPTLVIEHKTLYGLTGDVPDGDYAVPFGEALVRRTGTDVTIATYSQCVHVSLKAAEVLASKGISAEVIDLRTIVPLDYDSIIGSVEKTGRLVVVHEASRNVGVGAEIAARVGERAWSHLRAPIRRVCGLDIPVPYAADLERAWLPQAGDVVDAVLAVCQPS